jgi:phosphate butyryltransferase
MSGVKKISELLTLAKDKIKGATKIRVAILATPRKEHFAAIKLADDFIVPVFVGKKEEIKNVASTIGFNIDSYEIIDDADSAETALSLAYDGKIDLIMNGGVPVRELAHVLGRKGSGFLVEGKIATHVAALEAARYRKLMFVADAAMISSPDTAQKIGIIENAAALVRKLGIEKPKAALLAAVEAIYPAVPTTMEWAAIAKMGDRGQIKDIIIDGPLSFDCAISAEVARQKGIRDSEVAGDTDLFIASSMETANGIYKAMILYAGAKGGSAIIGGRIPVATSFEVDDDQNTLYSIAFGILAR